MYDELKEQTSALLRRLDELRGYLELDAKEANVQALEQKSGAPDFWEDPENAKTILREITRLKSWTEAWRKLQHELEDAGVLIELAQEADDQGTFQEAQELLKKVKRGLENLEFRNMLSGEDDVRNALLVIHPGAGGTESMDWAGMLLRMYQRWIERQEFTFNVIDLQLGEIAGIKSATLEVIGEYAYGYLRAEVGVHRLVRLSPFDANQRRHTSFASVFVYPEIEDDVEIEINPADLRVDTFRASGAGGQHVNKTDSAVRITHLPSGIVASSQAERSQFRNRDNAMKMLRAKLYQLKKQEEEERLDEIESSKREIAWGSQIRSYVFHPYKLVKDLRTDLETSSVQAVMDGEIDDFIRGYLMAQHQMKAKG
ncbi:MAG: peptide chain release factor 2 [bacterium]